MSDLDTFVEREWRVLAILNGISVLLVSCAGVWSFGRRAIPFWKGELVYFLVPMSFLLAAQVCIWRRFKTWVPLLMFVGGIGTFPLGVTAILGALRARRLRGRIVEKEAETVRCLKCGYDLRGLSVPQCPECGTLKYIEEPIEGLDLRNWREVE